MNKLQQVDIEALIGDNLPFKTEEFFKSVDFSYEEVSEDDNFDINNYFVGLTDAVESQSVWEGNWSRNLQQFKISGLPSDLIPGYFSMGVGSYHRYQGRFIKSPTIFSFNIFTLLRIYIFEKFLFDVSSLHEFGCGSGYNLYLFSQIVSNIPVYGYDFSPSAVSLVNLISTFGIKASGKLFDMKTPDFKVIFEEGSGVLTIGALEQVGENFTSFMSFLLKNNPKICVHMEPIYEFYNLQDSFDLSQAQVINNRGYLKGFLPYLESSDKIDIIKKQHVRFGSIVHEGWNIIVWKVKETIK